MRLKPHHIILQEIQIVVYHTVHKSTWLSLWESRHAEGMTERALSAPSGHLPQRERQVRCSRASALNCNLKRLRRISEAFGNYINEKLQGSSSARVWVS